MHFGGAGCCCCCVRVATALLHTVASRRKNPPCKHSVSYFRSANKLQSPPHFLLPEAGSCCGSSGKWSGTASCGPTVCSVVQRIYIAVGSLPPLTAHHSNRESETHGRGVQCSAHRRCDVRVSEVRSQPWHAMPSTPRDTRPTPAHQVPRSLAFKALSHTPRLNPITQTKTTSPLHPPTLRHRVASSLALKALIPPYPTPHHTHTQFPEQNSLASPSLHPLTHSRRDCPPLPSFPLPSPPLPSPPLPSIPSCGMIDRSARARCSVPVGTCRPPPCPRPTPLSSPRKPTRASGRRVLGVLGVKGREEKGER